MLQRLLFYQIKNENNLKISLSVVYKLLQIFGIRLKNDTIPTEGADVQVVIIILRTDLYTFILRTSGVIISTNSANNYSIFQLYHTVATNK